jgi:hypothetical protein
VPHQRVQGSETEKITHVSAQETHLFFSFVVDVMWSCSKSLQKLDFESGIPSKGKARQKKPSSVVIYFWIQAVHAGK